VTKFTVDPNNGDKRQLFIDATIYSLAEHGYKGTTVRKIAEIAGVTPGLLTHYFSGKELLIAESYQYLATKFLDIFEARIDGRQSQPLEALRTFITATFERTNLEPKLLKVWLSFWSLTLSQPSLAHIHKTSYRRYIDAIEDMLAGAYRQSGRDIAAATIRRQAIGLNALLDGMWIEWCLDPDTFSPAEGLEIVYSFVEATTGLAFSEPKPTVGCP
jgi:TetR/AcrR family transcriptional regulator, transcriptional repressor of bet genes